MVLAATNRKTAIDAAILRRLPLRIEVCEPKLKERLHILKIHLGKVPLADDVVLEELAEMTEGLSGSDLQEVCRSANILRLVDYMEENGTESTGDLRKLTMEDLLKALSIFRNNASCIPNYRQYS